MRVMNAGDEGTRGTIETHLDLELPPWVAVEQRHRDDGPLPDLLPEEQALVSPNAIASRKAEVRLGRGAARDAITKLGLPTGPILRGAHRQPLWPDGVVGSITHADGLAVAAVARNDRCVGLGIDLEHRERFFAGLADQVLGPSERAWIDELPTEARAGATVAVFSAKEAIFKALFPMVGDFFGFEAARLQPAGAEEFEAQVLPGVVPGVQLRPLSVRSRWHGDRVFSWLTVQESDLG